MDKNDCYTIQQWCCFKKTVISFNYRRTVHINYMDGVEYYLNTNTKCPKLTFSSFTNH